MDPGRDRYQRLDRNWQELLQELRVAQTGVQILTGFLLTIPFTSRFDTLADSRQSLYAVVLCCAVLSTILLMTPVALHRALFRQGARNWLVDTTDQVAKWGLAAQAVAIMGALWLILDLVASWWIACVAVGALAALVLTLWVALPMRRR